MRNERIINVDSMSLEGKVDWDGEIFVTVTTERELRTGKWETKKYRCKLDVYSAACVRRTLRRLSEESIANQQKQIVAQETTLADS